MTSGTVYRTALSGLKLLYAGKVRDNYAVDEQSMLIVTTDRMSAFDVVLPDPIPQKGRVLTQISNFWFDRTRDIVPNHLTGRALAQLPLPAAELAMLEGRAIIVKRLKPLPVEAVVRGYLIGSGWKDYQRSGTVCGVELPAGLQLAQRLPTPIFTPATKADVGAHDENISFAQVSGLIGAELAEKLRTAAMALYQFAADYARARGIIIADTKFEFGLAADGALTLMDEVLTPDCSRFWPCSCWRWSQRPAPPDRSSRPPRRSRGGRRIWPWATRSPLAIRSPG